MPLKKRFTKKANGINCDAMHEIRIKEETGKTGLGWCDGYHTEKTGREEFHTLGI